MCSVAIGLPPCSSFYDLLASGLSDGREECRRTYGHRLAQRHGLPHEELRALAHSHHARRLHGHHACGLHRKGPGDLEHVGGRGGFAIGVESGELASSLGSKVLRGFRHRHADAESSRSLLARKTPSELCVDKASRVEPSQPHNSTSVTTLPTAALPLPPHHLEKPLTPYRNHV